MQYMHGHIMGVHYAMKWQKKKEEEEEEEEEGKV